MWPDGEKEKGRREYVMDRAIELELMTALPTHDNAAWPIIIRPLVR